MLVATFLLIDHINLDHTSFNVWNLRVQYNLWQNAGYPKKHKSCMKRYTIAASKGLGDVKLSYQVVVQALIVERNTVQK